MRYFSGFGLQDEYCFFAPLLNNFGFTLTEFDIVGFDYGAQLALEYAYKCITNGQRVGKVLLLSPCVYWQNLSWFNWGEVDKVLVNHDNIATSLSRFPLQSDVPFTHTRLASYMRFLYKQDSRQDTTREYYSLVARCVNYYKNQRAKYMQKVYQDYGLLFNGYDCSGIKEPNYFEYRYKDSLMNTYCIRPNIGDLVNLLSYNWIEIKEVAQKAKSLIIFCGKNDRIVNSNFVSSFFSRFGYCFLLHSCNHLLRQESLQLGI
ncbi:hypothetical protein CQA66_03735 [Helicobacter aurati]|uniref:Alpha/beta hydrolase n=1 Tax=Helicobacter aurati TaxID=137778 RepID=A0A3D8J5E8_9HELI|nr:hypothetical protein [Helicobacter aurati]RDU72717.1 hypothetical protein CQA66_03735 [Helicobacter aurati]